MSLLLRRTISTPKCLFALPLHTIHLQQASPFSTLKTPKPRKPRTPKTPPPQISSKMVKKQETSASTWPRPTQIPFQDKVANSVNLFGNVEMPIQFHATPDGKHISATFISQKNVSFNGKSSDSLSIPVVFEGDLAHTVACHVKQDDCVYVTGKLSLEELPFVLSENQGKFYVIGEELNFVQGLEREEATRVEMDVGNDSVMKELVGDRKCRVDKGSNDIEKKEMELLNTGKKRSSNVGGATKDAVLDSWKDFLKNPMDWLDNREKKSSGLVKANFPDFKHKTNGTPLWLSSAPKEVLPELEGLDVDSEVQIPKSRPAKGVKVKNEESWKSLVENPDKWWDCRPKKTSIKSPDFKHKNTGEALWLNNSPEWVLSWLPPSKNERTVSAGNNKALEGQDVDAQVQVLKMRPEKSGKVKNEGSWKSLIENPDKWWDCRSKKTSIKSPDFKHKDTGEALWLNNSPEWVLSQLPPSKNEQHVSAGNKKAFEGLGVGAAEVQVPKWGPGKGGKVKNEDSWKNLVENPEKWQDNRSGKTNIKAPDFKHKETGEVLWLNSSPKWVLSQLPPPRNEQNVSAGNKKAKKGLDVDAAQAPKWLPGKGGQVKNEENWKSLVENPEKWWDNRSGKTNIKAPDFKHKETGEVLWLNSSPKWVLSQLPPPRNEQTVSGGSKNAFVARRGIAC